MRKNITLLILLIACPISGFLMANPVTESQAYAVAANFFRANNAKAGATLGDKAVQTSVAFNELYIFCGTDNHGFVIVSADDCVTPILGYSYESTFDPDNMPPQLIWWLQRYDDMIRQSRTNPSAQSQPHPEWNNLLQSKGTKDSEHQPIVGPLITTTWDQGDSWEPTYNKFCPANSNGQHAITGCVATAGAQIMKYWNHPSSGRGTHTYTTSPYNDDFPSLQLSVDFSNTQYDWEHMPTSLNSNSTETEIDAVATLMYHVGVAINMFYGHYSSGAWTIDLEKAFKEYFKYSNDISFVRESQYEMAEWKALLKCELDAQRPIIYYGHNDNGSLNHCFICDGYDNYDYFHFNWGWGGLYDGFFNIENPDPHGYYNVLSFGCEAIIGIKPNYGQMPLNNGTTDLHVVPNQSDFGITYGTGEYLNYSWVHIEAYPKIGYRFVQWQDGNRNQSRDILAYGGTKTYTALFKEDLDNSVFVPSYRSGRFHGSTLKGAAVRYPSSIIGKVRTLNSIQTNHYFNPSTDSTSLTLEIRQGGDNPTNGTLLHTQTYTIPGSSGQGRVVFDNPIAVNTSQPLWIILWSDNNFWINYNDSIDYSAPDSSFWSISPYSTNWEASIYKFDIWAFTTLTDHDPVENLQATSGSNNTIHITWDAPISTTPTAYTLAIGTSNDPYSLPTFNVTNTWYDLTIDETWTDYLNTTLTELMQNNTYIVYVRASYTNPYGQEYHSHWKSVPFDYAYNDGNRVAINAKPNDETLGHVTGGGIYPIGSTVTLEAVPFMNGFFMGWNEEYNGSETVTFTATESRTYTANFGMMGVVAIPIFNQAQGSMLINGEEVNSDQYYEYPMFSTIEVQAIPVDGYQFDCWDDGVTNNPRFINLKYTMEDPTIITALFSDSQNSKNYRVKTCQNQVEILTTEYSKVQIFDMLGRRVYIGQSQAQSTTSLTLDRKGVYIVKVGENEAEKIIIL